MNAITRSKPSQLAELKRFVALVTADNGAELARLEATGATRALLERVLTAEPSESLLPPDAAPLRRRLERVLESFPAMACGDYAVLLAEIVERTEPGTFLEPSSDDLLREVAEQILVRAGTGTGEVTLRASDLVAWGNTIEQALPARPRRFRGH